MTKSKTKSQLHKARYYFDMAFFYVPEHSVIHVNESFKQFNDRYNINYIKGTCTATNKQELKDITKEAKSISKHLINEYGV
jgi:hypothetical protein